MLQKRELAADSINQSLVHEVVPSPVLHPTRNGFNSSSQSYPAAPCIHFSDIHYHRPCDLT